MPMIVCGPVDRDGHLWLYHLVFRETGDAKYQILHKRLQSISGRLPNDLIPYWDFNAPNIPMNKGCLGSGGGGDLGFISRFGTFYFTKDSSWQKLFGQSEKMLVLELSKTTSKDKNSAFLLHSTDINPRQRNLTIPLNYGFIIMLEALLRLKKLKSGIPLTLHSNQNQIRKL